MFRIVSVSYLILIIQLFATNNLDKITIKHE